MKAQYPMRPLAKELEKHGRYGDSMLVHLNPAEVAGLAALSPTGTLTTNPVTGQPEAFLPMLAAGLGSWLGTAGAGALGLNMAPWLAGAIGSGVTTAAVTGDIKRGLASGVMGAGIGNALGAAGSSAAEAASGVGSEGLNQAAMSEALGGTASTGAFSPASISDAGVINADPTALGQTPQLGADNFGDTLAAGYTGPAPSASPGMGESMMAPFQKGGNFLGEVTSRDSFIPIAIGGAGMAQIDADEEYEEEVEDLHRKARRDSSEAYDNLQMGYQRARYPNSYAGGGLVTLAEGGTVGDTGATTGPRGTLVVPVTGAVEDAWENIPEDIKAIRSKQYAGQKLSDSEKARLREYNDNFDISEDYAAGNPGYGGLNPIDVQANLTGNYHVTPPKNYMTGFEPEFDYFQDDPDNIKIPSRRYKPDEDQGVESEGPYFESVMDPEKYATLLWGYYRGLGKDKYKPDPFPEEPGVPPDPIVNPPPDDDGGDGGDGDGGDGGGGGGGGGGVGPPPPGGGGLTELDKDSLFIQMAKKKYEDGTLDKKGRERYEAWIKSGSPLRSVDKAAYNALTSKAPWGDRKKSGPAPTATANASAGPVPGGGVLSLGGRSSNHNPDEALAIIKQQGEMYKQQLANGTAAKNPALEAYYAKQKAPVKKADGGRVPLQSSLGPMSVEPGGIAGLESSLTPQEPSKEDIQMLVMALSGQVQEPGPIIESFIAKYGQEVFDMVRQQLLQGQNEGVVQGQGGGMDDQVPGTIAGGQPVAVSPGEFIVPADVVSGIGDGSTEAGAAELEGMMQNVRMARGGSVEQPPALDAQRFMPR